MTNINPKKIGLTDIFTLSMALRRVTDEIFDYLYANFPQLLKQHYFNLVAQNDPKAHYFKQYDQPRTFKYLVHIVNMGSNDQSISYRFNFSLKVFVVDLDLLNFLRDQKHNLIDFCNSNENKLGKIRSIYVNLDKKYQDYIHEYHS